jgi:hypothetical protein
MRSKVKIPANQKVISDRVKNIDKNGEERWSGKGDFI